MTAALFSVARADETDIRRELEQIKEIQLQAFKRKDVKAYMKYLAPNYSVTTIDGHVLSLPRPDLESEILSDMEETVSIKFTVRDVKKIEVKGNLVVVVVNQKSSRVLKSGDSQNKWDTNVVQRERWIKTAEGLKLSSIEALEVIYLIQDGKLITGHKVKKR